MKIRYLFAALLLPPILATPLLAELPPDAEVAAKIIGTWDVEVDGIKGTDILKADGTFTGSASGTLQAKPLSMAVEGKWSVKDGMIIETITKSDHPGFVPIGSVTRDKLIEVTDKMYKARTESGTLEVHTKR